MSNNNYIKQAKQSYKELVDKFIYDLERGVPSWQKSWKLDKGLPKSAITGGEYSGINLISLMDSSFASNEWITKKQVEGLGGYIKDAQIDKAKDIFFLKDFSKMVEEKNKNTGEIEKIEKTFKVLRSYKVYNTQQVEGISFEKNSSIEKPKNQRLLEVDEFVKSTGATIMRGEPAYDPNSDYMFMPEIDDFKDKENYYSTLFHELTHWSGHKDRLNRKKAIAKWDDTYAFEELVAELGSAFLCAKHHISMKSTQHTEYLNAWIAILKKNPNILFSVASHSSKSTNFLSKLSQTNKQEVENKNNQSTMPKIS